MKFPFLHFIALILIAENCFSQNLFREGYIEKKSGNILNGMVEYKANQKMPDKCVFKRFDIALKVSFTASEIKAFGYKNGRRYESFNADHKSVFYEVLVSGKITLYIRGSEYFVDKEQSGIVKIEDGPIEYMENGIKKEFDGLQSFLFYLTEGNAGEIKQNFKIKNDLLPLIIAFNKKSGQDFHVLNHSFSQQQLAKEISLTGVNNNRFGILTGVNFYNLKIKPFVVRVGEIAEYTPDSEIETGPILGISYERSLLRKSEKFSARFEVYYTSQNFYCYEEPNVFTINEHEAFYDFKAIKTPLLLQYAITGKRAVPFINAGVAFQYILSGNYLHIENIENSSGDISTIEDSKFEFRKGETSAVVGLGVKFRLINKVNLNLQTRFECGTGLFENYYPEKQFGMPSYRKPYIQNSIQANVLFGISF